MSKTHRLKPPMEQYITRAECHALIVHVINEVFAKATPQPAVGDNPYIPAEYAARLRALRVRDGLTQTELAQVLGVSYASVSRWENGLARPSSLAWRRIALAEAKASSVGAGSARRYWDVVPVVGAVAPVSCQALRGPSCPVGGA